jgi:hypothetical protein
MFRGGEAVTGATAKQKIVKPIVKFTMIALTVRSLLQTQPRRGDKGETHRYVHRFRQ